MHTFNWTTLSIHLLATLTAGSPVQPTFNHVPSSTRQLYSDLSARAPGAGPSDYPYGTPHVNEMMWEGWDPNDAAQRRDGQRLHDAYAVMKEMVVAAIESANAKTPTFKRWFAEADADKVKGVLERIVVVSAPPIPPEAHPRMKQRVLDRTDFLNWCGRRINAYTNSQGRHHFCERGIQQPALESLKCADLDKISPGKYYSSRKIRTISGTMLHESTHWPEVGRAVLGEQIIDVANGERSYNCHKFSARDQLLNAQNYAFFASEAYMRKKGCIFTDPPESAAAEEDEESDFIVGTNTKAINIIYRSNVTGTYAENDWYVYETPVGQSALCKDKDQTIAKWDGEDGPWGKRPDWPAGTFNLNVDNTRCQYKNSGKDAGALWCLDRVGPIQCKQDPNTQGKFCDSGSRIYQRPYVYCEW